MLQPVSEYFCALSGEAKSRYIAKVTSSGLESDPYAIPDELWVSQPEKVPEVSWSDMFIYMISTPSVYTKEEIKVR